jgi:hypothetical protein
MPRKNQYAVGPIIPGKSKRPPAPAQLDAREKEIWCDITRRLPTDWFTTDNAPLKELCRHIRHADDLAADLSRARTAIDEIRKMPEPPAELLAAATQEYRAVLRAHGYQTERIGNLATKLRLTPQARYAPSTGKREALRRGMTGVSALIANNSSGISTGYELLANSGNYWHRGS